ncbi:MAG: histidine kinase [Desulfovibrionaceae bacterium]|nr:PAS domain-containing protein [Desulfovibrionaceae bacterium]PWM71206.1 MAG: histidine kinase [Desulfovibrionaceae bacterium]
MKETILLVDDEQQVRVHVGLTLRNAGYAVLTAGSGEEALQTFARRRTSIAIVDAGLADLSGLELLKRWKAIAPDTEIILTLDRDKLDLAGESLKLEASDVLFRPVDPEVLLIVVKRAQERISMRSELHECTINLESVIKQKSAQIVASERKLAARQAVDGFAFGLHALMNSMSGDQRTFNELPCFVAVHDRYMQIQMVNDLYRERLGNLVGEASWTPYVHTEDQALLPVERAIVEGHGVRGEAVLRAKDGAEIPVMVHTAPILNNEGEVELVLELSVDIQESRRLRDELRHTRERYRQLFEESPSYVSVVDREYRILEANRAYRNTFGPHGSKHCYEQFMQSGEICDDCPVRQTFQEGCSRHTEKVVIARDGLPINVLVWTAPLRDESGKITQCIEMATDITELRRLQDRLASLGLLMGSTAHGIKGMLTALDGSVYRLGAGLERGDEPRMRDSLKDLKDMVGRLRKMVLDILYFAKERELDRSDLDLGEFLGTVVGTVSDKAAAAGIAVELENKDAGIISADASTLSSALVNLLENAVDACRADSKPEHKVRVVAAGRPDTVDIRVEDNGIGMSEEARAKLFTLFFSSKGKGGTGIGLYVARQIVMQHGGRIEVESIQGAGSVFTVVLPRLAPPAAPRPGA